jgi:flagellar basal body rod protein FlgG
MSGSVGEHPACPLRQPIRYDPLRSEHLAGNPRLWGGPAGGRRAQGLGSILGSTLEGSNVNLAEEMVTMMNLQRSFEISLRTLQQTDQMLAEAIHMRQG